MNVTVNLSETEIKSAIYDLLVSKGLSSDITRIRFYMHNGDRNESSYITASAECILECTK